MVQYYKDMWPGLSHILDTLAQFSSGPNVGIILWNDYLESFLKQIMRMFSAETLLFYPDWKLPLIVHTDELLIEIEGIRMYIDDILVLSQDCFIKHI